MKELTDQRKVMNGRKADPIKQQKLDFLRTQTGSLQEKADALNAKFKSTHNRETVRRWSQEGEFRGQAESTVT